MSAPLLEFHPPEQRASPQAGLPLEPEANWSSNCEDLIVPRQLALKVYVNSYRQICIRQEAELDDDADQVIFVSLPNVDAVVRRIQELAEAFREGD